jgi:uridine phosphorylase
MTTSFDTGKVMPADRPADADGVRYHIALKDGQIPSTVLIPGDPARIDRLKKHWDNPEDLAHNREFRSAKGTYRGYPLGAISVGVGMGGVEVTLNELATIGVHSVIRVGTTGSLHANMPCGDLIIPVAGVRRDGTSDLYVEPGFPAFAHPTVLQALIAACERLGFRYHLGIACSTASFYLGQARPIHNGYFRDEPEAVLDGLRRVGVTNFDMETAGVFVLGHLMNLRVGSVLAVRANRATNELADNGGEDRACLVASEAAAILQEQDADPNKRLAYLGSSTLAPGPQSAQE